MSLVPTRDFPTGDYHSPADLKPRWWARPFPTLAFYAGVFRIVQWSKDLACHGEYGDERWIEASWYVCRQFEKCGAPLHIEGVEHFRDLPGPLVFIGNHMSTAETFMLGSLIGPHKPVTFVVKKSLVTYPLFGPVMRSRDPIVVGRENARDDLKIVLEGGEERLKRGRSLIVFPQRTRTVDFNPAEFNSIGVKLAKRAGATVIPVAVKTDAWGNGTKLKDFGPFDASKPVHVAFGEPLQVTGTGKEANETVIAFIQQKLAEWELEDAAWRERKK
ncbi:MAG: lysophospholipid acyltransferase family protein [Verrucomicrobiota bacterium JB022]|nr:lysophospholipid acyltransferase family protein [Verrucomicrobiota bacterium JB022]